LGIIESVDSVGVDQDESVLVTLDGILLEQGILDWDACQLEVLVGGGQVDEQARELE
jgi:hypothetical protein